MINTYKLTIERIGSEYHLTQFSNDDGNFVINCPVDDAQKSRVEELKDIARNSGYKKLTATLELSD